MSETRGPFLVFAVGGASSVVADVDKCLPVELHKTKWASSGASTQGNEAGQPRQGSCGRGLDWMLRRVSLIEMARTCKVPVPTPRTK
ncbi:hypothetical protein E4U57_005075 [Claviceps arundinis]|uniref:Secreted protein n=1 Tax=Claviceps arundinis TaxID=1623583 RepID=A0ABQ7P3X0_9HYPO|nr:hypothetical protein E4U57_005075 [Claviceps arundinis]